MRKIALLFLIIEVLFVMTSCANISNDGIDNKENHDIYSNLNSLSESNQSEDLEKLYEDLQTKLEEIDVNYLKLQSEVDSLKNKIYNLTGNPMRFTESAPMFNLPNNYTLFANFDYHQDASVSFDGFMEYCKKEFGSEYNFYLLKPMFDSFDFHPNRTREYSVYVQEVVDDVPKNPLFYELTMIYSEVLGDGRFFRPDDDGYVPWSIELKTFFAPVDSLINTNTVYLRFGDNNDDEEWKEYINIYVGGVCIGTTYLRLNTYVSQRWIEQYYMEYLIKIFDI